MIRLLWRQLLKHRIAFSSILLVWVVSGLLLANFHHQLLTGFSHLLAGLPEKGQQDPEEAHAYILSAEQRLKDQVRLDLMANACRQIPLHMRQDIEAYRPHWVEKIKHWNLSPENVYEAGQVVEPDGYWHEHAQVTRDALKDLVDAISYAYEVRPEDVGEAEGATIIVAERLAQVARAVCREDLAILAWGDYVEFLEVQAYHELLQQHPEYDTGYIFPSEKEVLVLESLKQNPFYLRALREYLAGSPPAPDELSICSSGMRLSCVSSPEAIRVYQKLLYAAPDDEGAVIRLNLGRLHLLQSLRYPNAGKHRTMALNYFTHAAGDKRTEESARMAMASILLQQKNFSEAYRQLQQLSQLNRNRTSINKEFRDIARLTLMGLGRFTDADCFADMAELPHGRRYHCRKLEL